MRIENIIDQISKNYSPLTLECQQELYTNASILSLEKGFVLIKEGEYSDKTYYVLKGCTRAYYLKDGKDITDWLAFENEFINSICSYFLYKPSPHYIELLEDSILVELTRNQIEKLANKYHCFERLIRTVVTKTMLSQQEKISSIQFYNAKQKYENILVFRPDIIHRVPLTHIASYLGITLETLSRVRKLKKRI